MIMTNNNIYAYALSLIGETESSLGIDDYGARAPILLAGIIGGLSPFNSELGGEEQDFTAGVEMTDEFPLDNRLTSAAAHLLAAELILDENPELYATLLASANRMIADAMKKATVTSPIVEVY